MREQEHEVGPVKRQIAEYRRGISVHTGRGTAAETHNGSPG